MKAADELSLDEIEHLREHNASLPIATLSAELVLDIISLTGPLEGERYDDASQNFRYCSQVCHAWRNLALSAPLLWASCFSWLDFRQGVEWTEELLRRCGVNSKLSVGIWLHEKKAGKYELRRHPTVAPTANIELLSQRIEHIESLTFYSGLGCKLRDFQDTWESFFGKIAPSLTTLIMGDKREMKELRNYFTWDPEGVGIACPELRHLKCLNSNLAVGSPLYRQLTTLDVSSIAPGADAPSALQWLAVIKTCQSLVSWSFEGFMLNSHPSRDTGEPVSLPSLAHLRLHLHHFDVVTLFTALQFPSLRTFDVIVAAIQPSSNEFTTLTSTIKQHIDAFLPTLKPSPLHISFADSGIRFTKEQMDVNGGRTTFSIEYQICPSPLHPSETSDTISLLLSALLPHGIAQTEQLSLYIIRSRAFPIIPSNDCLLAALSPFQSVTTLRFACYRAERGMIFAGRDSFYTPHCPNQIDPITSYHNSSLAAAPSLFTLLPQLSHLFVQPITSLDRLKEVIVQRVELGLPIKTIQFSDVRSNVVHRRSELPSKETFEELADFGPTIIIDDNILKILQKSDQDRRFDFLWHPALV